MAMSSSNTKTSLTHWLRGFLYCVALLCLNACGKTPEVLSPIGVLEVPYPIQSMAWHPNGKLLAVGYFNRDEVEVWDVENKKSLFTIPSNRRLTNQSGQEVLFSTDGKYLVVQDLLDTKNGEPKHPRNFADPAELPAQEDVERYIFARVWNVQERREIAQIKGAGSTLHGRFRGMCFVPGQDTQLVVLRATLLSSYELLTGKRLGDIKLRFPFPDQPDVSWAYEQMNCNTGKPEIALAGGPMMKSAHLFGFPKDSGATPIVVVDMERKAVKKVLFSATPLNGLSYTANGGKLVSFGAPPMRVWDVSAGYSAMSEIADPKENVGEIAKVPGFDGLMGMSLDIHFWNASSLRRIYSYKSSLRDVFRVEPHLASSTVAVAEGRNVHLFRINVDVLNHLER
jgi:hypothetical protein